MERDIGDILDRCSIACLKAERISTNESKNEYAEFSLNMKKLCEDRKDLKAIYELILNVNSNIWKLESELKSGKEILPNPTFLMDEKNSAVLSKIGMITILIRDFNSIRVGLKNLVNLIESQGYQDKKLKHLSE
jgi:hypothetical protein